MKMIANEIITPHSAVAFELQAGQFLRVSSPEGEQVGEMICYNLSDPDEWLCSGRTLGHNRSWILKEGQMLYSNRSNAMLSLQEDSYGRHDFLLAPCNQGMFSIFQEHEHTQASCHENLYGSLMGWDIDPDEIYTTFSIFMHVNLNPDGSIAIEKPKNKPNDHVLFQAEMNLVVGLSACSSLQYNGGSLKSIQYQIFE